MELDCSSSRFIHKNTFRTGLRSCYDLCYLSEHDCLVISGKEKPPIDPAVQVVSCQDGSVMWRVQDKVEGAKVCALGLFSYDSLILVADGFKERILVLDASNGSCLKTIQTPGGGSITCLGLCNTQIVMLQRTHRWKMSFFSIN